VMGRIVAPFGVQGWVKVRTYTEQAASLGEYPRWLLRTREGWREVRPEGFRVQSKGPVAKLEGCDDREAADGLRGADIAVLREELGEAEDGSHYWVDLVGLEVVDADGSALGKVTSLFESGETSVLVVRQEPAKERMIPFVADYVKGVDREARRITVDWKADYDT
jgi:16S rRNA processing protein RimM